MHYGHPDVFDRIFHITRGGISKASRVINISEDIYAGNSHVFMKFTSLMLLDFFEFHCIGKRIYKHMNLLLFTQWGVIDLTNL